MTLDIERNSFKKPIIVIMSRAHPSETISSFVMQGIMSYVFEYFIVYIKEFTLS